VKFYEDLTEQTKKEIYKKYGKQIQGTYEDKTYHGGKRYCTLIWLTQIQKVKPFQIDKTGYGNMTAWLKINSIKQIKV
ncbi:MAG: hypothetical protein GOV15_03610, partial [Candidatus Diapherotrites archaeon]|nr:hypothetical protein [Candidatus Diapherotrites archaeon]